MAAAAGLLIAVAGVAIAAPGVSQPVPEPPAPQGQQEAPVTVSRPDRPPALKGAGEAQAADTQGRPPQVR